MAIGFPEDPARTVGRRIERPGPCPGPGTKEIGVGGLVGQAFRRRHAREAGRQTACRTAEWLAAVELTSSSKGRGRLAAEHIGDRQWSQYTPDRSRSGFFHDERVALARAVIGVPPLVP